MQRRVRFWLRRLLPLATIGMAGCVSVLEQDSAVAVVPYRLNDAGQIVVETRVNGRGPFSFSLDTGATISVVFDEVCDMANLDRASRRPVRIQGMIKQGTFPTTSIERLSVGAAAWTDAQVAIIPGETPASKHMDGILGVDFMRRYSVGFSSSERVVRLYPPELVAQRTYRGWWVIPLRQLRTRDADAAVYVIDLLIRGRKIPAIFDLGAGFNLMNWRALRYMGIPMRKRRSDVDVSGAMETVSVDTELTIEVLRTGGLTWRRSKFLIADLPILDILEFDNKPIAIVGTSLFEDRDFVIDLQRDRLLVSGSRQ